MPKIPWPLAVVLGLFLIFGIGYVHVTPYRTPGLMASMRGPDGQPARIPDVGAPDERQHANYIKSLRSTGQLPVFRPGAPDFGENYQNHQPPLYYLLAAGLGDPGIHTRLLNVLIGLATVVGVYCFALWGVGRESVAAAAAAMTLLPGFLMLHGAITNDPLLFCLVTWALAAMVRFDELGWDARRGVVVGGLVGAAFLTKQSALVLFPVVMLLIFWVGRRDGWRAAPWSALVVALALATPWMARNLALYGDPLALTLFEQAFVGSAQARDFIEGVGMGPYLTEWVGWWTWRSLIGAFGYMDIFLPRMIYLYATLLLAVPFLGWAVWLRSEESREPNSSARLAVSLGGAYLALVLLAFLRFNLTFFQGQARYLLPAAAPIFCALGAGWGRLHPRWPMTGAGVLLLLLSGLNAWLLNDFLPAQFALRVVR